MNRSSSRPRRPPIATLRDRQREAVTAALLDAAEAVVAEKGLPDAGMAEIARRAGVAVGTLYNYFPDRDGLVRTLLDTRRAVIGTGIRAVLDATTGAFEPRLRAFVRGTLALLDEHRRFVRLAFEVDPPLPARGKRRAVTDTIRTCLQELVAAGVADGALAPRDVELRTRALGGSLRAVVLHELEHGAPFVASADGLVDLFLRGAAA